MPRIQAANIDEHVRQQTHRIVGAARRLFAKNGYHATDLGAIAAEVGLARNSLYRYYANKDQLLLACIREDMEPYLANLAALADTCPDPVNRIVALVNLLFDLATGPAHATLELISEVREGSRELRNEIGRLHMAPNILLENALTEMRGAEYDCGTQAALLGGMVMAATARAMQGKKKDHESIRSTLLKAVRALLAD